MFGTVRNDPRSMELGPTVHWPTVIAAAAIVGATVAGLSIFARKAKAPPTSVEIVQRERAIPAAPKFRPPPAVRKPSFVPTEFTTKALARSEARPETIKIAVTRSQPIARSANVITVISTPAAVPTVSIDPPADRLEVPVPTFKRLDTKPEVDHLESLLQSVPEVDLDAVAGSSAKVQQQFLRSFEGELQPPRGDPLKKQHSNKPGDPVPLPHAQPLFDIISARTDLDGLPFLKGGACQTDWETAEAMASTANHVRRTIARRNISSLNNTDHASYYRDVGIMAKLQYEWQKIKGLRLATLLQLLQSENTAFRRGLIEMLGNDNASTSILVNRALFDLDPAIREQAINLLKQRPASESRLNLLAALRHPWPPVAQHAAETLVALNDREAVAPLRAMLDQPNPAEPYKNDKGQWLKPELVRINHLGNCLLCHSPSLSREDPVRGVIPTRGKPLPVAYYHEDRTGDFVRADVVYIRQQFSVSHPVEKPNHWPVHQRFDYVIRQRQLTKGEVAKLAPDAATGWSSYPQREAVVFAIRELSAQNPEGWQEPPRRQARR